MTDFETWWRNEGSDPKRFNEDWEEHCKRMCQIAWSNGAFKENEACEALYSHEDVQAPVGNSSWGEAYQDGWIAGAQAYRDAIRERGKA